MITETIAEVVNDVIFRLLLTTGVVLLALEANIKQYRVNRVSNGPAQDSTPHHEATIVSAAPSLSTCEAAPVDQVLNTREVRNGPDEEFVDAVQDFRLCRDDDEPDNDYRELLASVGCSSNERNNESLIEEIERLTMENNAYKKQVSQLHFDIDRLRQENSDMVQLLNLIESQLQTQQLTMKESSQNIEQTFLEAALDNDETDFQLVPSPTASYPTPMFHIVCVGDSGVGKTSFIRKLCTSQDFIPTFSTTIGIDFLTKTLVINQRPVTLQMWDTAGQERYRCLTQQYFRKADGVIIMYDVTSESSFRNLHSWLDSAQAGVSDGTVLVLVGNKRDLVTNSSARVISELDGAMLAKEFDVSIFSEVSAKSGTGVLKIVEDMTSNLLLRNESSVDKQIVHLTSSSSSSKQLDGRPPGYRTYSCLSIKPVSYLYTKK